MRAILALDAGGTNTRAVVVDEGGCCRGFGRSGGGNPVSSGFDDVLDSLDAATQTALGGVDPRTICAVLIAMAGGSSQVSAAPIAARLAGIGIHAGITIESDLLATFCSGTSAEAGFGLVVGTGAIAARIENGREAAISDGAGWLLGDDGSGFWIGRRVARAVVAALDGRAPETALTGLLLDSLGLTAMPRRDAGRPVAAMQLMHALYALRPVELSRFAPLAFQALHDPVAHGILTAAATRLLHTLAAVRHGDQSGPIVLGGGVLGGILADGTLGNTALDNTVPDNTVPGQRAHDEGTWGDDAPVAGGNPIVESLRSALTGARVIVVNDGVVGAAVLGLRGADITVDAPTHARLSASVAGAREAATGDAGAHP